MRTRACSVHVPDLRNTAVLVLPIDEDPHWGQPEADWKIAKSLMNPSRYVYTSRGRGGGHRRARLHDCTTARLHDCSIARLHDCTTARLHDCTIAQLPAQADICTSIIISSLPTGAHRKQRQKSSTPSAVSSCGCGTPSNRSTTSTSFPRTWPTTLLLSPSFAPRCARAGDACGRGCER